MADDTYNGWANKPTWLVKLWIDNEQSSQEYWHDQAHECFNEAGAGRFHESEARQRIMLADRLKDEFEGYLPNMGIGLSGFWADLIGWALAMVDWDSIAVALIEDAAEVLS